MKDIIKYPAEYYLKMIDNNEPFSFIRIGDGEILCAFPSNILKENCDGSKFTEKLVKPMRQIFINNHPYYHCFLDCTFEPVFKESVDKFRAFFEQVCPDMDIYDGEIWQQLSFSDRIGEFIDAVTPYEPCFIGSARLENMKYMHGMGAMRLIAIPEVDAFDYFDEIYNEIVRVRNEGCRMFLFSAGYSTKILIDKLFPLYGKDTFFIDCGSLFDPYCGKLSRSGMKHYGFQKFQPFTYLTLEL